MRRSFRERDSQYRAPDSFETSSPANAVPLPLIGEGISRSAWEMRLPQGGERSVAALLDIRSLTPFFERVSTFPYEGKGDRLRWMRSAIAKNAR